MSVLHHLQSIVSGILVLIGAWFGNTAFLTPPQPAAAAYATTTTATRNSATPTPALATSSVATTTKITPKRPMPAVSKKAAPKKVAEPITIVATTSPDTAVRIFNPYPTAPLSFETINTQARGALVNIFCIPNGNSLAQISATGVIIDPRGVILTNAHVGQYSLLEESNVTIECLIRTGSPARASWHAKLLYISPWWISKHASEITQSHTLGTGENDFALLLIDSAVNDQPLPTSFPFIVPDVRESIAFEDDEVLVASYPAGFVGSITAQNGLYPVTTTTRIKQLMTFETGSVDVIDVGGVVVAQAGSSGGAVINRWNKLVGLLVTSSVGMTTQDRSLRADTLAHVDRSLADSTGMHLQEFLQGDLRTRQAWFAREVLPALKTKILAAAGLE